VADHQVIEQLDVEQPSGLSQLAGDAQVLSGGRRVGVCDEVGEEIQLA
jgi:hypothetical protein